MTRKKKIYVFLIIISLSSFSNILEDYTESLKLIENKHYEEGVKKLEEISKSSDPEYVIKSNYSLGEYYLSKNDLEKSKSYYKEAIKNQNSSSKEIMLSLYQLSNIAYNQHDNMLAEVYLLEMDSRKKGLDANIKDLLGKFYLEINKDYQKSEDNYKKATQLEPENIPYKLSLLELYEKNKDILGISQLLSDLKKIDKTINDREIGLYYLNRKNYLLGEKYLQKAAIYDDDNIAKFNLGILYYNLDNKVLGLKLIEEASKNNVEGAKELLNKIYPKTEDVKIKSEISNEVPQNKQPVKEVKKQENKIKKEKEPKKQEINNKTK